MGSAVRFVVAVWVVLGCCALVSAASGSTATSPPPTGKWFGWLDVYYVGDGQVNNGNCSQCFSGSHDGAGVETDFHANEAVLHGSVALDEVTDYNSQCSGIAERQEEDSGKLPKGHRTKARAGVSVTFLGNHRYRVQVSPPGISYKGTITEEKVAVASGHKRCTVGKRNSSGVFYFPAIEKPIVRTAPDLQRFGGEFVYHASSGCTYPRNKCLVDVEWFFALRHSGVPENPGKPHHP